MAIPYTMKTGNLGTGTQITLTNGQKAIKFSSGVYPLGINGFPDVQGKITDESFNTAIKNITFENKYLYDSIVLRENLRNTCFYADLAIRKGK